MDDAGGMSTIVKVVTRWLFGLVIVFGLAVALFGHVTPGGGFAGGVIIACGFVLATLAFGVRTGPAAWLKRAASSLDATGALAFLVIALLGFTAGHFLQRWLDLGEPFTLAGSWFLVLLNLAILVKVGAGVFAGFAAIALFNATQRDVKGKAS